MGKGGVKARLNGWRRPEGSYLLTETLAKSPVLPKDRALLVIAWVEPRGGMMGKTGDLMDGTVAVSIGLSGLKG